MVAIFTISLPPVLFVGASFSGLRRHCPTVPGVLTLFSVPLCVRSGSVSAHIFGISLFPKRFSVWKWAGVAQLVEHLICNQRVGGSNPFASSTTSNRNEGANGGRFLRRARVFRAGSVLRGDPTEVHAPKARSFPDRV